MALDFPNSPTNGQTYTSPSGSIWVWDGTKWVGGTQAGAYLPLSGGTLTGALTIASTTNDPLNVTTTVAGTYARARFANPTRTWSVGAGATGEFLIADETGPAVKLQIPTGGGTAILSAPLMIGGGLSVGGNTPAQLNVESGMTLLTAPAGSGHGSIYLQSDTNSQYRNALHAFQSLDASQPFLTLSAASVTGHPPIADFGYGGGGGTQQLNVARDRTATGYSILNLHSVPGVGAPASGRLLTTPGTPDVHLQAMVAGRSIVFDTENGAYQPQVIQGGDTSFYGRIAVGTANGFVGGGGTINATTYYMAGVPHLAAKSDVATLLADGSPLPLTDWEADPGENETCLGLLVNRGGEISLQPVVLGPEDSAGPGLRALAVSNDAAGRTGAGPKPGPTREAGWWDQFKINPADIPPLPAPPPSPKETLQ